MRLAIGIVVAACLFLAVVMHVPGATWSEVDANNTTIGIMALAMFVGGCFIASGGDKKTSYLLKGIIWVLVALPAGYLMIVYHYAVFDRPYPSQGTVAGAWAALLSAGAALIGLLIGWGVRFLRGG